jgi:hypothetical protein
LPGGGVVLTCGLVKILVKKEENTLKSLKYLRLVILYSGNSPKFEIDGLTGGKYSVISQNFETGC